MCVKEDKALGLMATEEETKIKNVIWDGEALLDVSEFERVGYKEKEFSKRSRKNMKIQYKAEKIG